MAKFKPTFWRFYLGRIPSAIVVGIFIIILNSRYQLIEVDYWPKAILLVLVLDAAVAPLAYTYGEKQMAIMISHQSVRGPWNWGKHTVIPFDKVDIVRSRQHALSRSRLGSYYIYSTDGKKITVDAFEFGKDQFDRMLKVIDEQRSNSAMPNR
jgi:hypothetical protein